IKRVFGKSPVPVDNVDEMVALGAALYAALKSDGAGLNAAQSDRISKMTVSEIANHYFGTIAHVHNPNTGREEEQNSIVIKKGERIPCSVTEQFVTASDNQTSVDVRVTQAGGLETDPQFVKIIWNGFLDDLPPNRPAGQTIEITYAYDANQTMQCTFMDVNSQKKVVANLSLATGEGEDSAIDQFLVD
ncbi:MAG: Hsp70 family protein, partial [Burkholderiales bacterium]|nr:Hsp70 family protein [Burkholderiales bacterium]